MTGSLFWHDYETFGVDPQRDRPVQFAGLRTDFELNPIDEPVVVYSRLAPDYLPQPEACLITGITPQQAQDKGVCEAEFIAEIHRHLVVPGSCTVGYNNLRFDDEVTRNVLYRNFYDPYAREWQNGNSRWDIIDLVRATRSLRPEGIVWPENDDGSPCLRLDRLTVANGIEHGAAHDALADVIATIALAKLIRQTQPKLYHFVFTQRGKKQALQQLNLHSGRALVHVSGRYPSSKGNLAVVLPLCRHPSNTNGILVFDLMVDPEPLLSLSVEQIQQRIFTATADLPEGVARIPVKTVHVNKCPVLAPISVLRAEDLQRLHIDKPTCQRNIEKLLADKRLPAKLAEVFSKPYDNDKDDPDLMLYSGGFFNDSDRAEMNNIRRLSPEELAHYDANFYDQRLPEMLFRYRARNFPESLNAEENQRWLKYRQGLFQRPGANQQTLKDDYFDKLKTLQQDASVNQQIIQDLIDYARQVTEI